MTFKPGDVVTHKNGQRMTVDFGHVYTTWFDPDGNLRRGAFPLEECKRHEVVIHCGGLVHPNIIRSQWAKRYS